MSSTQRTLAAYDGGASPIAICPFLGLVSRDGLPGEPCDYSPAHDHTLVDPNDD